MTEVFVFGSNLAGRHGKGAALYARQHYGAIYGNGIGMQSRGPKGSSYAIPTKDENLRTLPLEDIEKYVHAFLDFAEKQRYCSDYQFQVTSIGCGLAGYSPSEIAPLFYSWDHGYFPLNVTMPIEFLDVCWRED